MASRSRHSADDGRRIAVLVDAVAEAEDGVIAQQDLETLQAVLRTLGYEPVVVAYAGDATAWLQTLIDGRFALVFNLCEGLCGKAAGEHLPAAAVELLGIPMTGAGSLTLALCLQKDKINALLHGCGVRVPEWTVMPTRGTASGWRHFPAIVKPVAEDASIGIGRHSVVRDAAALTAALDQASCRWDRMLVQRYIAGREFNLAIAAGHVLPHAEIDFSVLPEDCPAIVTHAAKWEHGSIDDRGTIPRCEPVCPQTLDVKLAGLAESVWTLVDGRGYGRIDVRVDDGEEPFVIDVNPNPDLSPGAGLARQAASAGWTYTELIRQIVADALAPTEAPHVRT